MTLDEKLLTAEKNIRQPAFLENRGLGNEVAYYILDYYPSEELDVRQWVNAMIEKYKDGSHGFKIIEFDLYDIIIEIMQSKGYMEKLFDIEKKRGFEKLATAINSSLRVTSGPDNQIIKYIKERLEPGSVLFLTGIGKCYPILRSHNVLNNMHLLIDEVPVVMFYPGKYSGLDLSLFGEINDNNYYRAFRLVD